ncbi:MAG: type II toxin-antitoxin system death-on-curing family toxin [Austwickia sp.]|nr:type II toxin-antitoxin system death-on-curing family toxin [Actinomycetota bacterium]MCB1253913.1 type II toxin-antitoxin system death-on-curing family toxin [Austwickia sp.]MCO5310731.1 type II toxin-antitoxin system death-on-curing family toxin [Austwickia sp.]
MIYLTVDELLYVATRALGAPPEVRDLGLLAAAAARPAAGFADGEAYPTLLEKAAALVHSVVTNHALVDGNKRLGLAALIAFLGVNGVRLTATNDEAYDLICRIADGRHADVAAIAAVLGPLCAPVHWGSS